uniref:Uncharacterized protein n=1 Tax=Oryza glumipatula TaxID=40148 RepID=A0A0E0A8D1_9ORYZ
MEVAYLIVDEVQVNLLQIGSCLVTCNQHQPWHLERLTFTQMNLEGDKMTYSGIFHVTVRFYGVPESLRLCSLVDKLIQYTATFSDSLRYKQDKNIIGLVVFGVTRKPPDTILIANSTYKINKICAFRRLLFHNCVLLSRTSLLS